MDDTESVEMDDAEIATFLGREGTGVLSLAKASEAYSIPVSYGYDDDSGPRFYLRLGFAPDSEKRAFLRETTRVALVVYDETAEGWRSVVARGPLEEVPETAIDADIVRGLQKADIPLVSIFDRPMQELEFTLHRLVPDELTGRKTQGGSADELR